MLSNIDELINQAKEIINNDREKHIKPIFLEIEQFLVQYEIPVNPDYENFWKYETFPILDFRNFTKTIKSELLPLSPDKLNIYYYVDSYIYYINYNKYPMATFTNIFWPYQNTKYTFITYTAPARLNKELTMRYIHPKYSLEDVLRKMYGWSGDETVVARYHDLLSEWKRIDPAANLGETEIVLPDQSFNKYQLMLIQNIKKDVISADYDPKIPIFIGSKADIKRCKEKAKTLFSDVEIIENSSKSFFDPRTTNFVFKKNNYILAKIWCLLDHELIPILPSGKYKVAHISVLLKLALTENITYEILGLAEVAKEKLDLFSYLIQKEQDMITKKIYTNLKNCSYIGRYYPMDKYTSTLRSDIIASRKIKNK